MCSSDLRTAFLEESGVPLIRRHGKTGDPLFTPRGFEAYADDLLERMINPYLHDRVGRAIRDPARKLGWSERIFGTMRVALEQGVEPMLMALGAAAAVSYALEAAAPGTTAREYLLSLWGEEAGGELKETCLRLVEEAMPRLRSWRHRS